MVKNLPDSVEDPRDMGLVPGSGRSLVEGSGNPLTRVISQDSCLGNPMDREAWRATGCRGCKELNMTEHTHTQTALSQKPCTKMRIAILIIRVGEMAPR